MQATPVKPAEPTAPAAPAVQVPEPLSVVWQGVEYRALRWDVHGFDLETAIPRIVAPGRGRVFDLTVLIGQGGTRIEMRVQARIANPDDPAPTRFDFVDLDRAQSEVLHRIVDAIVSQQALSLTRLLNETEQTREARKETGARMRRFRSGFQLTLAGSVLAVAGLLTWSSFSTVKARYAAITVGATSLSVPVAGRISRLTVGPGETLTTGEVLGYVRPSDFEDRLEAATARRRSLEVERAELLARRGTMAQLSDIAIADNGSDRARLEETLLLAERRLSVEQSLLAALQGNGLPTASRLRERARQEAAVLRAETDVLDVRARLATLARAETLAPLGVAQGDLRSGTATLDSVDLRLAALNEEIDHLTLREARAEFGEPILSPCDCTVQQIDRRVGEWAEPSGPLAVLVGHENPTIHALVLAENARDIDLGDRARIELANGSTLDGQVARLDYDAHWRGYAGLQDTVFAADRYARLEITPNSPLTGPVGMVAQVSIHTSNLFATAAGLVGL
jgi:multidrug resistance efflux pump